MTQQTEAYMKTKAAPVQIIALALFKHLHDVICHL